jgi:polyisoprenoid-binding protein YceI
MPKPAGGTPALPEIVRRYRRSNTLVTIALLLVKFASVSCSSMKALSLIFFAGVWVCATAQANDTFKIDPSHSTIEFKVRQFLGTAKGKFTKFGGSIEVDRDHPEQSSVTATIQAASIDTAIAKRDEHLRSGDFFNVGKYPEIIFKSRRVKQTGANAGEITGDLTMHGVTHAITLNVELLSNPEALAKNPTSRWRVTTAPIRRSQFGLVFSKSAETVSMIADEVTIEIEIEARKQ